MKIPDVISSSGCVTTRKSVVRFGTASWERWVWVCDAGTELVDLGALATSSVEMSTLNEFEMRAILLRYCFTYGLPRLKSNT